MRHFLSSTGAYNVVNDILSSGTASVEHQLPQRHSLQQVHAWTGSLGRGLKQGARQPACWLGQGYKPDVRLGEGHLRRGRVVLGDPAPWLEGQGGAPCELTVTTTSAPCATWPPSAAGSWCVAYVPENAASVSDAPGDSAASRPAMFTCARHARPHKGAVKPMSSAHRAVLQLLSALLSWEVLKLRPGFSCSL